MNYIPNPNRTTNRADREREASRMRGESTVRPSPAPRGNDRYAAPKTFDEAKAKTIGFGKHKGKTIEQIAETDDGLLWLDWLRGEGCRFADVQAALDLYLDHPTIAAEVSRAIAAKKEKRGRQ